MSNELIPITPPVYNLSTAAQIADQSAATGTFDDFRSRRASGTIRR